MLRLLGTRFIFRINKSFLIKNENKKIQYVQNNFLWHQNINFNLNDVDDLEEKTDKKKKKSPKIPKITLIHPNNSITITQLEDAEKLADRRNLQLVHDGIIKNVKSKVQGIFSEEKKKGSNTVFIYSPSENENISSKDNTV
ncbi:hypothetical protein HZU67_06441 [Apis mellifera carnica]|uniref:Uncharacterized protein LOC102654108 n=1 Tax=Apis mellifera TaxID=7460 RepID=A0A7M7LQE8_APIME|nr:uncharacterized protein LOC102654108 [Apis mellifera]KAG9431796.1 hypothetical protein HZU67_06441 [Apis mellifera carnica]|eukprot:XP_006559684.2 uncharacterized protein LOC102654108 [Apis mellifera]